MNMNTNKIILLVVICFSILSVGLNTYAYENPVVSAGPDLYLISGQTATLQGSAYDVYGYPINYYWSCSGGNLSNYNVAQPIYTAPRSSGINYQTTHTCTLTVTNSYGNSSSDSAIVYIDYNSSFGFVQTSYATSISNLQANLNGTLTGIISYSTNYVYFQWGTTESYGNETIRQSIGNSGSFIQNIYNLSPNTTYHFRAVAEGNFGKSYGGDMTFSTTNSGYYGNNQLNANKKIINLTLGYTNWSSTVNANPSDVLTFAITLQPTNQDIHNVAVRDILPSGLIYGGSLLVNTSSYQGNITSGINIGTVYANQPTVISYKVQVAVADTFSYGTNTLSSNATITSNEFGTQSVPATIIVNRSSVYGVSTIPTGITNNPLTDSFFIPLFLIFLGAWSYFSGNAYKFADWIKNRK